jgi:hypothetical protein
MTFETDSKTLLVIVAIVFFSVTPARRVVC